MEYIILNAIEDTKRMVSSLLDDMKKLQKSNELLLQEVNYLREKLGFPKRGE